MAEAVWLIVAEIARRLGQPASTVASWREAYEPERRFDERGRALYRLDVFERIAVLDRRKRSRDEVKRLIASGGDVPEGYEQAVLDRLDRLLAAVERIADRLDRRAAEEEE